PRLHAERSMARNARGDRQGALRDAETAVKDAPDYPLALRARAEARLEAGQIKAGWEDADRAVRLARDDAGALATRSRARMERGELAHCLDDAERAFALDPRSFDALSARAYARDAMYLDRDAAEDASRMLSRQPGNPHALRMLSRLAEYQVGRAESEKLLRRAVEVLRADAAGDAADLGAKIALAGCLRDLREYGEAAKVLEEARKRWPEDDRVLVALGLLAYDRGEWEEAEKRYAAASKLAPENPVHLLYLGRAISRRKDKPRALAAIEAGLRLSPNHPELAWKKARLLRDDDPQAALDECSRMVALYPNCWYSYQVRAELAQETGDPALSLKDLESAGRLAGNDPTPRCERGDVLRLLGRLDEALAEYSLAEKQAPKSPRVFSSRARTHSARKDHAAAVRDYERALALDPEDPDAYEPLGKALHDAGRYEEAARVLAKGKAKGAIDPDVVLYLGLSRVMLGDPSPGLFEGAKDGKARDYKHFAERSASDESSALLDIEIKYEPDDAALYAMRARTHLNGKRWDKALANADVVRRLLPRAPVGHLLRGKALAGKGDVRGAVAEYDRALRLAPRQAHLWIERGELHLRLGNKERAKADALKAKRLK
ncbi:MAG: tetratricopeptide repeat protein, partial [Gemmataceae bacterium]|nr:tetratricopeptide repeat protein [Gemmataceae bacterium]